MTKAVAVNPAQVVKWLRDGWRIVAHEPFAWLGLSVLFLLVLLLLLVVPRVGPLFVLLFAPVLGAGMLFAAREADQGRPVAMRHLLQGFQDTEASKQLLILGGIAAMVLLAGILVFSVAFLNIVEHAPDLTIGESGAGSLWLAALAVMSAVSFALIAYATALIMFEGLTVGRALRAALGGCVRNVFALLLLGAVYAVLAFVLMAPIVLAVYVTLGAGAMSVLLAGAAWLTLLVPFASGMFYASCRDFFPDVAV